jgi:spermidine synthase
MGLCRGEISGPFILDTAGTRHLYFDLRAVQSSMRLEEPDALVTAYAQKMMAFLLFNRAPRRIVMIGLGGGSLVKFCHRHLQSTRLTVVEIDPDIIELREWFHIGRKVGLSKTNRPIHASLFGRGRNVEC